MRMIERAPWQRAGRSDRGRDRARLSRAEPRRREPPCRSSSSSLAFVVAALCAGVMGYAIQRGATCTVAAVDEVIAQRTFRRLLSLLEAALWVAGGLIVAQALHLLPKMPAGYAVSGWTVGRRRAARPRRVRQRRLRVRRDRPLRLGRMGLHRHAGRLLPRLPERRAAVRRADAAAAGQRIAGSAGAGVGRRALRRVRALASRAAVARQRARR